MKEKTAQQNVTIIAGPCSVDKNNVKQLLTIANIKIINMKGETQRAIWGLRVVGLKSRTNFNSTGEGMGMDFDEYIYNANIATKYKTPDDFKTPPSVEIVKNLIKETGLTVAVEIMDPFIQLPMYEKHIPNNKLLLWNPAVNQLGYKMYVMGIFAERNNWFLGIKNGKWLGEISKGEVSTMEKAWEGQVSYATKEKKTSLCDRIIMIHRGVDIEGKGDHRSLPVHDSAKRVKKNTGTKMFFDPSHSFGPGLRDKIVEKTVEVMHMKSDNGYLYDGILVEVGDSKTDTHQHITISELQTLVNEIAKFRNLSHPDL